MTSSRSVVIPLLTILGLLASTSSYAQTRRESAATTGYLDLRTSQNLFAQDDRTMSIRQSLAGTAFHSDVRPTRGDGSAFQASGDRRPRSTTRKVIGGIVGGVGGFFGGAFLGAAIEGDRCNCDDPGFVGFLIGAPVGATVGAILGVKFF